MPRYRINGTDQRAGSLGIGEPFTLELEASSEVVAINKARANRYQQKRDNVHIEKIRQV